jgi:hypothetical protein
MQELYVDDISDKNAESNVEASGKVASDLSVEKEKGNSDADAETLENQKGVSAEKSSNSETVGEGTTNAAPNTEGEPNFVKATTPEPNVVPDVETSLAHEEPTSDTVGDDVNEQDDGEPANDEETAGGVAGEHTTSVPTTDNAMSVDEDVVDVDAIGDLHQTVREVVGGSIARRLRNRKGKDADVEADAVVKATPAKKKENGWP